VESKFFYRRERIFKAGKRGGEAAGGRAQYGAWRGRFPFDKKDAPSGTLIKLVNDMKNAVFARIDTGSNRAGAHPGRMRSGSIRGGYNHFASCGT